MRRLALWSLVNDGRLLFLFLCPPQRDLMAMMISQTDSRQSNLRESVLEVLQGDQDRLEAVEGYYCLRLHL